MPESNQERRHPNHPRRRARNERRYPITKAWHTASSPQRGRSWGLNQIETSYQGWGSCRFRRPKSAIDLLNCSEKFQSKQAHLAGGLLPQHARDYWRRFAGHYAGGSRGWSGDREMNDLIFPQLIHRRDTRSGGADVERLRQFDEFGAGRVGATQKDRHLQTETSRPSSGRWVHALGFLDQIDFHFCSLSTRDLVRIRASLVPDNAKARSLAR
jgi:hypothetical protein